MRKLAIGLGVGVAALAVLVPLGRLVAQGSAPEQPEPAEPTHAPTRSARSESLTRERPTEASRPKDPTPTMLVNTRRIRLNYGLSDLGPSGVSALELWATRDGRTWQCYSNEPPPNGPLVVHVAEEGRYGFFLVVRSGVGSRSAAPKTGDLPQLWVEVDETAPKVKLTDVQVGTGADAGKLLVAWSASDINLMPQPINLCVAPSKDGPWAPVLRSLDNRGRCTWTMPKDVPYQFFVKVEAVDRAGNVGCACTAEPVKVDLARPRGKIFGVELETKPEPKAETVAPNPTLTAPVSVAR